MNAIHYVKVHLVDVATNSCQSLLFNDSNGTHYRSLWLRWERIAKDTSKSKYPIKKDRFNVIAGVLPEETIDQELHSFCNQIVELDYDNTSSVNKAFEKPVDYLFLIPARSEERALQVKRLVAVAIENQIKFIVLVSLLDCHSRGGPLAAQFRYIET